MVHYNVQSLASKTDIIEPELTNFDIISLIETWLRRLDLELVNIECVWIEIIVK